MSDTYPGRLADPEFRHRRAKRAAESRTGADYHLRKLIESAPRPTPEMAARLRAWLPPVRDNGEAA